MSCDLRIDVSRLRERAGEHQHVERTVELPGIAVTGATLIHDRADVDLELESMLDGVVAHGHLHARWRGSCRRCLDDLEAELDVAVEEIYEDQPVEGETYPIVDDVIDLEPLVRDALVLALPLAPLCRPDCPGPDPDRFPTGGAADDEPAPDPRWAALDELRFD